MTKKELIEVLTQAGISRLEVGYDGGGDEAWIDMVECYGPTGGLVEVSDDLASNIEEVSYELLYEALKCGWGGDDGAFGSIEIDVATATAKVFHSWRETRDEGFDLSLREAE